jgi:hypothetical protein
LQRDAVLSVVTGGGKWVEIATHADPLYQHLIVTAERKFWRCVESGEPPRLFGVEPPKPRIEAAMDSASVCSTVPLCRGHHCEIHCCGGEAAWWNRAGIDPTISARALWLRTHPLPSAFDQSRPKLQNEVSLRSTSG